MRGGYQLSLEQSQQLVMTPRLQQALAILQMTSLELQEHLQEELLRNPVLEEVESQGSTDEIIAEELPEWVDYFSDASDLGLPLEPASPAVPRDWLADSLSLVDYLAAQLVFEDFSPYHDAIAHYILGCLDDAGFLQDRPEELAAHAGIRWPDFERVWQAIRLWDPAGVAAVDLADSLQLQLQRQGCRDQRLHRLVSHHLPELLEGKFRQLAEVLGCSPREVQAAAEVIGRLNPRPGSAVVKVPVNYTVPDVCVERVDDQHVIVVHDQHLPRLALNRHYLDLVRTVADSSTKHFLKRRIRQGLWLLRSVEQRKLTLYRVVSCVVRRQQDFFRDGPGQLHPLTLRAVGDELGIHESTVSRAVAGKYVSTPRGLFALHFFFPSTLEQGISSEQARVALRTLIAREDATRPLSDGAISHQLAQQGICLSRRTVTKYRHALGIPPIHLRRRY